MNQIRLLKIINPATDQKHYLGYSLCSLLKETFACKIYILLGDITDLILSLFLDMLSYIISTAFTKIKSTTQVSDALY